MKSRIIILILSCILLFSLGGYTQVAITSDGSSPNSSAMLDVKSTARGFLVPRMTSAQMSAISGPATGLLVYNTTTQAFYNYSGTAWIKLDAGSALMLKDTDGNTKVEVEKNSNEDIIRFSLGGTEKMVLKNNRLELIDPNDNLFIGSYSGATNSSGSSNTAIGFFSMYLNGTGQGNTCLGYYTLLSNSSGSENVAIGNSALMTTTGSSNVGVGSNALYSNTTGYLNTAIGKSALHDNTTGHNLVAVGDSALYNQEYDPLGRYSNTAVGSRALYACTNGYYNTATGYNALKSSSTGSSNTANGFKALLNNTSGFSNTAIGSSALYQNTTGGGNTAVGVEALFRNTSGWSNSGFGYNTLYMNETGSNNVAIGYFASYYTLGDNNTSVGSSAGDNYTFISGTFLGANASTTTNGFSNCMALGYNALVNASNKVVVGNTAITSIGGYATWTTFPSDQKFKKNVSENVPGLAFITQLRPVTYQLDLDKLSSDLKEDQCRDANGKTIFGPPSSTDLAAREEKSKIVYTGFLAQEVEAAAKSIGYDFSGVDVPKNENGFYGLRYAEFVVPLVKGMQEQQVMIERQQQQIEALLERIEKLEPQR